MASSIDPTKPLDGVPAVKADLRANLAFAKAEIEALQAGTGLGDGVVTLAKLVDASGPGVLLGRGSAAGSGPFEEITLGSGLTLTGTVLSASGSGLPTDDTTALVQDPVDTTKRARIDAGAVATATTRVIIMGDRDVDLAVGGTFPELVHPHSAADLTSGVLADARVAQSNVTQHQAALVITMSQVSDAGALATLAQVATAHIADNAVTLPKMADASVGTAELVDLSVTEAKLATDSVTNTKIATGAVGTDELAASSVTTSKIADSAVGTTQLADASVTAAKLAAGIGGSSAVQYVDGTAAGANITEVTAAVLGTTTPKRIGFDQAMTLDNALPADTAFYLHNAHATDTLTVTIEAGAGGTGAFDTGGSTYQIPAGGETFFNVASNAGDEPQIHVRGDGTTVDFAGRDLLNIGSGSTFEDAAATRQALGVRETLIIAVSDETTDLTTGAAKVTFRMPFAMTLLTSPLGVRASVNTAPTGAALTVDINEGGVSILSTKLTIDAGEETSVTAATPAVISDTALADDAEITIDIDQVGSTAAGKGLKVVLMGFRTA